MMVKVSRLTSRKPGDLPFDLMVMGHLIDKDGNLIPEPLVGQPICLADKPGEKWRFMTSEVEAFQKLNNAWLVKTYAGPYMIFKMFEGS